MAGYRPALLATGENRAILRVALVGGGVMVLLTLALAAPLGAFALPTSELGGTLVVAVLLRRAAARALNQP